MVFGLVASTSDHGRAAVYLEGQVQNLFEDMRLRSVCWVSMLERIWRWTERKAAVRRQVGPQYLLGGCRMLIATSAGTTLRRTTQPEESDECRKITVASDERTQLVERFRSVLASKNLNVNTVSRETERIFGGASSYFIPHNFCYDLVTHGISPHVCQVLALSKLTGYSFSDLLALFAFRPDEIPRLQLKLHRQRTVLLPSVTYDKSRTLPYLGTRTIPQFLEYTGPCARIASKTPMWSVDRIEAHNRRLFLYARIGSEDAIAFPELVPGSIVRVDPFHSWIDSDARRNGNRPPIYLIEHQGGLVCCQASLLGGDRILLTPPIPQDYSTPSCFVAQ